MMQEKGATLAMTFYQTLGSTIDGRRFLGYINSWNWTNFTDTPTILLQ